MRSELNPNKTIIRIWLLRFLSRKKKIPSPHLLFFFLVQAGMQVAIIEIPAVSALWSSLIKAAVF